MRIAGVLTCSLVNGEGIRYVIFTQGCKHGCRGCHNPDTWDMGGGYEVSVEELAADIRKHRMIDGITLSGGDPMYQEAECLLLLDERCRNARGVRKGAGRLSHTHNRSNRQPQM